jgi:hypothetical protein
MCRGVFCDKLIDIVDNDDDMPPLVDIDDDDDDMPPFTGITDDWSEQDERFAMAHAQEGMDFEAIIAAIANDFVTVRNNATDV